MQRSVEALIFETLATRTITRAGTVLAELLERLEFRERLREHRVWNVWDEVAGPLLASKAQPLRIQEGKLFVRVANSTWMQELQFLKDDLRSRLNRRLGGPIVRDVFFVLGRVKRLKQPASEVPIHPVDEAAVAAMVPPLHNPELEEALRRVVRARARRLGS